MHDVSVSVLSSGSCGNSFLVTAEDSVFLIDAGLPCREIERRISLFGVDASRVEAVVLTHEHTDHVRGARRFCATHEIPAYATKGTLALTPLEGVSTHALAAGRETRLGNARLRPFKVPHLAAEPVAFVIHADGTTAGIASDLGSVTPDVVREMTGSDIMFVEANYDEQLLAEGGYPDFLKRAIRGDHGHLSNSDAGTLAAKASGKNTRRIVLVHLSEENNTPERARIRVQGALDDWSRPVELEVAEHGQSKGPFKLR